MKSFSTFLSEAPKDLVGFAQRYARRQMRNMGHLPEIERPSGADALYIRVPGYDPEATNRTFQRLDDTEAAIMGPYPREAIRDMTGEIGRKYWERGRRLVRAAEVPTRVKISDLVPSQAAVEVGDPEILRHKIDTAGDEENLPRAFMHKGKITLVDGHHRVLGSILKRDREILVRLLSSQV